jgi:hypothetical protein
MQILRKNKKYNLIAMSFQVTIVLSVTLFDDNCKACFSIFLNLVYFIGFFNNGLVSHMPFLLLYMFWYRGYKNVVD